MVWNFPNSPDIQMGNYMENHYLGRQWLCKEIWMFHPQYCDALSSSTDPLTMSVLWRFFYIQRKITCPPSVCAEIHHCECTCSVCRKSRQGIKCSHHHEMSPVQDKAFILHKGNITLPEGMFWIPEISKWLTMLAREKRQIKCLLQHNSLQLSLLHTTTPHTGRKLLSLVSALTGC